MDRSLSTLLQLVVLLGTTSAFSQDSPPKLIDIPDLTITPQGVELGIRYKESGSTDLRTVSTTNNSSSYDSTRTGHLEHSTKETITYDMSSSMNASGSLDTSLDKVVSFKAGASLTQGSTNHKELFWSDVNTYNQTIEYKTGASDTTTKTQQTTVSYGDDDGFIHTGFQIKNTWGKPITISNIRASVVLVSPSDPNSFDVIAGPAIIQGNRNTYPWLANADAATSGGSPLELNLAPGTPAFLQPVNFDKVNSAQVRAWLGRDSIPELRLQYKLSVDGNEVSIAQQVKEALSRGVSLLVVDQDGKDHQFYIKTRSDTSKISALEALKAAGYTEVTVSTKAGITHITKLNGRSSDCLPSQLADIAMGMSQPNQGAWVFAATGTTFAAGVSDEAPSGTSFIVMFMTRHDRLMSMRQSKAFRKTRLPVAELILPLVMADVTDAEWPLPVDDPTKKYLFSNRMPVGVVHDEDVVTLTVRGWRTCYKATEAADPTPEPAPSYFSRAFFTWAVAKTIAPDCSNFTLIGTPQTPGDYGIAIDAGNGEVALDKVVPKGKQWFDVFPDGTVQIRFVATSRLLRNGPAILTVIMNPPSNNLVIGRTVTPPPRPSGDHMAAIPLPPPYNIDPWATANAWANIDPNRTISEQELRQYDVEAAILHLPTDPHLKTAMHSLAPQETAAFDSAQKFWSNVDGAQYSTAWESLSKEFKAHVPSSNWIASAQAARNSLGTNISREVKGIHLTSILPTLPLGSYVVITYKSVYEHQPQPIPFFIESLIVKLEEDNVWRVMNVGSL